MPKILVRVAEPVAEFGKAIEIPDAAAEGF